MTDNWKGKVYRKPKREKFNPYWTEIREAVLKRDKRKCQRCDKTFPKAKLTVHHIMPRSRGGTDNVVNLVTLCNPCHDFVEINDLDTLADIMGSYEDGKIIKEKIKPAKTAEDFERPAWHTWVYGGTRNPNT